MQKQLPADPAMLHRLTGTYLAEKEGGRSFDLFIHDEQLWLKNELFGQLLLYQGHNTFAPSSGGEWSHPKLKFELRSNGKVNLDFILTDKDGEVKSERATKG
jgi:hypothetical protein